MDIEANKAVVRRFIEAINAQDFSALDELVAEGFVRHSGTGGQPQVRGREGFKDFLHREATTFPDAREDIHFLIAEGDKVAARLAFSGTQHGPGAGSPRRGSSGTTSPP